MSLNKDIIPIMYMGGTGGHFISAFIRSAREHSKSKPSFFNFSEYGNAHRASVDLGSAGGVGVPIEIQIKTILNHKIIIEPPCCPPVHFIDIDATMKVFEKAIKITYDDFDIHEISHVFFIKQMIEEKKFKVTNTDDCRKELKKISLWTSKFKCHFQTDGKYEDRVLSISWKEIYKQDTSDLIIKLSNFTGIPECKFNKNKLEEWRTLTKKGVDLVNQILNTDDTTLLKNDYFN